VIGPTDIITIFGQRGSGKSELGRAISKLYPRLVVIDKLEEWTEGDLITSSFDAAADFLADTIKQKEFKLVFRLDIETKNEKQQQVFNELLRLIYKRGKETGENVCLLIEEVHFYCTSGHSEEWLAKCLTVGRHANLAMIASSQRPAQVDKLLVSQAAHVFVGQLFEHRDIAYLKDTIGPAAAEQVAKLPKYKFLHHRIGEPAAIVDRECFGC